MPTWGQQLKELQELAAAHPKTGPDEPSIVDILRRKYMKALADRTGRAVIVYETAFLEARSHDPAVISVHLSDVAGFMEAVSNVTEHELDLFIHSPGGSAEAAESIVEYLRTKFDHIRVIVPVAAMSAATMMALAADEIVMGAHSQLGPIDPQFTVNTPEGPRSAPGQAIIDQFELAKKECQDPKNLPAWLPILRYYGPGLIAQCDHQRELAESYVAGWLERFMFKDDEAAGHLAQAVAAWFADFKTFKSHGRRVSREAARAQGVKVVDLELDQELQDAILSVHHAFQHTFAATQAGKIIENHHGRAWMKITQTLQLVANPVVQPKGARPPIGPNLGGGKKKHR